MAFNLTPSEKAAIAYDATAVGYDEAVVASERTLLHQAYRRAVRPGDRVIDAGCGTGIDSGFLSELGADVVGVDISEGMLRIARSRTAAGRTPIQFCQGDLANLDGVVSGPVDAIVSGFAALNTCTDLAAFSRASRALLRPGGMMVIHVLTPGGLFDRLGDLGRGRLAKAAGGRGECRRELRVGTDLVPHHLVRPDRLYELYLRPFFGLIDLAQIGALTPGDRETRVPSALAARLHRLDLAVARWPGLRNYGRFGLLTLKAR